MPQKPKGNKMVKVGLQELYLQYDYKTRDVTSKTIPKFYFPKSEITDHKYSLTYKEWSDLLKVLFTNTILYLLTGATLQLPHKLGNIFIGKIKGGGVDWVASKKAKKTIRFKNPHTQDYRPYVIWDKKKSRAIFKHKWLWRFTFTKTVWRIISDELNNNFTLINNLKDVNVHSSK